MRQYYLINNFPKKSISNVSKLIVVYNKFELSVVELLLFFNKRETESDDIFYNPLFETHKAFI
jgi:hypothetical protein